MKALYEPKGKAREYSALAVNLYTGCEHGCVYCYAPDATFKAREQFARAVPRNGIIAALQRDLQRSNGIPNTPIMLCFTCDPYQPIDDQHQLTRQAIQVIKAVGRNVCILTKAGKRAERDLDLLGPGDDFGASLTLFDESDSLSWEPHAAIPEDRFEALRQAKSRGISTWASLEPVIYPDQTLKIIERTHEFVDLFKVGVLNYHPQAKLTNWTQFALDARALLESLNARYIFKKDLQKWLIGR